VSRDCVIGSSKGENTLVKIGVNGVKAASVNMVFILPMEFKAPSYEDL